MRRQFPAPDDRRCTHLNDAGKRCAQYKMKAYDTCCAHTPEVRAKFAGTTRGMRNGNQNGYKSGWYQKPLKPMTTLKDLLDDLLIHHTQLSLAITGKREELPLADLARVVSLQVANALRISRLMKDQDSIQANERNKMLDDALDQLGEELGIKL
jgi:hypothetical protein